MSSPMLGPQLREQRERKALTQAQVAQAVEVPRELVSMWETGARLPHRRHLERLAALYRVATGTLTGASGDHEEREALIGQLPADARARRETQRWLDFLDAWSAWLVEVGEVSSGPQRPPRALDEGQVVTDARRAPTLAGRVREHYRLGLDALPDLRAFLDEQGVLVYRAPLGAIGAGGGGISGAFYNHARLGFCILVNAETTPGRQTFTLAHEFAHALFHHPRGGLISRKGDREATETFADAFAAHFLVPGRELRRLAEVERRRGDLDPYQALHLAAYFRVSYATMLIRLREERCIDPAKYAEWRAHSPTALARATGLPPDAFNHPAALPRHLDRYPASVLERVRRAIRAGQLTLDRADALLEVDRPALVDFLATLPAATAEEEREFDELPF